MFHPAIHPALLLRSILFILLIASPGVATPENPLPFGSLRPVVMSETATEEQAQGTTLSDDELRDLIREYVRRENARIKAETYDPGLVPEGAELFDENCTLCHEAGRSTARKQSLSEWRRTIRRMAEKPASGIPKSAFEPIAAYLTSLHAPEPKETDDLEIFEPDLSVSDSTDDISPFDFHATFAPVYRVSARDDVVENEGFNPDFWVGVDWRTESPLSARASACITCHRSSEPEGSRIELAEGVLRFDVAQALSFSGSGIQFDVEAGRFSVPFGSLAARNYPQTARTVTQSLLFTMGQTVHRDDLGPALLPLPYFDEGLLLSSTLPVGDGVGITLDAYVVNGLIGTTEVNFFQSRDYSDNNGEPAIGGRISMTSPYVQLGASAMSGRLNEDSRQGPTQGKRLGYQIYGADAVLRYQDIVRLQVEYAHRESEQATFQQNDPRDERDVSGLNLLGEVRLLEDPRLSLVTRWDTLKRTGGSAPQTSILSDAKYTVRRWTWGFGFTLPGGSQVLINHEHWSLPDGLSNVDVVGLRWIATF